MKVGWLIDGELFDSYRDDLVAAIRAQGHDVKLVRAPSPPYHWEDSGCSYRNSFAADRCVVAVGDIGLVSRIESEQRWVPGAFATIDNFYCSSYFCRYGEFLLNADYLMLPFGEMRRCKDFLFQSVGRDGRIFVRPDSPLKLFTGQVVAADSYEKDLEYLGFYEFPESSLVVVSAPQSIDFEWRFVVAEKAVVAGSQYRAHGKLDIRPDFDVDAKQFAERVAATGDEPDPVWVVDVCKTSSGDYRLLEIGGFSFCDLYLTDKSAVVDAVSRVAFSRWQWAKVQS